MTVMGQREPDRSRLRHRKNLPAKGIQRRLFRRLGGKTASFLEVELFDQARVVSHLGAQTDHGIDQRQRAPVKHILAHGGELPGVQRVDGLRGQGNVNIACLRRSGRVGRRRGRRCLWLWCRGCGRRLGCCRQCGLRG